MTITAVDRPAQSAAERNFLIAADAYASRFAGTPTNMMSPMLLELVEGWRAWKAEKTAGGAR